MNNTITLSQLITRLAKATGVDNNTARRFLRVFFDTVEESIEKGETVTVKGIGTFRSSEPDSVTGKSTVAFVPDSSFLEELNRPFEMFEAVELADGVDFSELDEKVKEQPQEEIQETTVTEPIETVAVEEPIKEEPHRPLIVEHDPIVVPEKPHFPDEDDIVNEETEDNSEIERKFEPEADDRTPQNASEEDADEKKPSRLWVWIALTLGIACIVGYLAAILIVPMPDSDIYADEQDIETSVDTTSVAPIEEIAVEQVATTQNDTQTKPVEESVPEVVAEPEPEIKPVYDTVEISLIKLAKKHYGVADYWVFIFDANSDKIKNPNSIRPGTKVRIPDKSELPGDDSAETRAIAKKKSAEYLAKY